eukprot:TRINITY_DN57399_c0_g1_i1.p1 TRINITY_DN57399_c0_g1~~TRINITY_DN57399_c0_g1_i1.p1  ORF type:complete len:169 (+),score=40.43 TRINITY_DN57399_c0_g1_i1:2-508(+)
MSIMSDIKAMIANIEKLEANFDNFLGTYVNDTGKTDDRLKHLEKLVNDTKTTVSHLDREYGEVHAKVLAVEEHRLVHGVTDDGSEDVNVSEMVPTNLKATVENTGKPEKENELEYVNRLKAEFKHDKSAWDRILKQNKMGISKNSCTTGRCRASVDSLPVHVQVSPWS